MKTANRLCCTLFAALLLCSVFLAGCAKTAADPPEDEHSAMKPSVMVNGTLYGTTGRRGVYTTKDAPDHGGYTDGTITSSTDSWKLPTENDQSNFGTGFAYRYGEESTVEVFFAESHTWIIFESSPA